MYRLIGACVCTVLGILIMLVAVPTALRVGTDNVITTPTQTMQGGQSVVLDENIVPFTKTTAFVHVQADSPLFVGTANGVDVDDYLADTSYQLISKVDFPGHMTHRKVSGSSALAADPGDLDWWTSKHIGNDITVRFSPTDDPEYVVVTTPLRDKKITVHTQMGLNTAGVFGYCLLGFGIALLLIAAAILLVFWWRADRLPPARPLGRPLKARLRARTGATGRLGATARIGARARIGGTARIGAVLGVTALAASGCAAPVQPRTVEPAHPTKIAMPHDDAPKFLNDYAEKLDHAYRHDLDGIDDIQTGPQLKRTRALMITADADNEKLSAPQYKSVVAAAPRMTQYPLWFIARAKADEPDYLLVERTRATEPWHVAQTVHVDTKLPSFIGRDDGSAPQADAAASKKLAASARSVAHYLQTGIKPDDGTRVSAEALTGYRDYVKKLDSKESGFTTVEPKCSVHNDANLTERAVQAKHAAIALAEVRCTLKVGAPKSFSLDLGSSIEALLGSDGEGSAVEVTSSHPIVLSRSDDGKTTVAGADWYLIGARSK